MKYLLDTHTVLWFWWNDPRLSSVALRTISDPKHEKLVSLATPWEVGIKVSRKKLDVGGPPGDFFRQYMGPSLFTWLPFRMEHFNAVATLPFYHKDPFDRILVAQSLSENIPIIGADTQLDAYGATRIW